MWNIYFHEFLIAELFGWYVFILCVYFSCRILLGICSVLPCIVYPLMKRVTYWPQIFLGEIQSNCYGTSAVRIYLFIYNCKYLKFHRGVFRRTGFVSQGKPTQTTLTESLCWLYIAYLCNMTALRTYSCTWCSSLLQVSVLFIIIIIIMSIYLTLHNW